MTCEDVADFGPGANQAGRPESSDRTGVTVVIPAFDEAVAVATVVKTVHRVLSAADIPHEILVVDDGSTDGTAEEAAAAGVRVLRHTENRGYGAAIKSGIMAARYDQIVISDADATYPAEAIPALVAALPTADMVVGARRGPRVNVHWTRRPAKWVLGWVANRVAGRNIPDLNSGLRAFHRPCVLQYFAILSDRFSFTTTVTLALLADGYRVMYQTIDYYPRVGRSKIRPWHFMEFMVLVLRMAMLFQPLRVFTPLATASIALGVTKFVFDCIAVIERAGGISASLLFHPLLSTSAVLLLLVGLQLLLVGMVADGVLRRIGQQRGKLIPSRAASVLDEFESSRRHASASWNS